MQYFEWYLPNDGNLWNRLKDDASHLSQIGVTAVWIPPCYKATDSNDVGYGAYDMYDLGEFDQKGTVRTKYGTKQELHDCIDMLHENGILVYADVVLNHKAGGDELQTFRVVEVDPHNRNKGITEPYEIEGFTRFTFPGRNNKYSDFKWSWEHFSATDYNHHDNKEAIYVILGENKGIDFNDKSVSPEFANFDYLMFTDIDYKHPEVYEETKRWISWFIKETKIDGIRLDAIKHINDWFVDDLIKHVKEEFGDDIPVTQHPVIRSAQACYKSSSKAIELAKKTGARLHIFHISTGIETELFRNDIPLEEKMITAEVCVHHLYFSVEDYKTKGNFIKWNPAVKSATDREKIWEALLDDRIDVIATDHAPHTLEEKSQQYSQAPSGGPLVQHSLITMLEFAKAGKISLEKVVQKMMHNPAILFKIEKRGFVKEGFFADLALVDLNSEKWTVTKENVLAKCGWSPLEGVDFTTKVESTVLNGKLVMENGVISEERFGQRLLFNR